MMAGTRPERSPGLLLALLPVWRAVLPRLPRLLAAALLTAALPYGWMVWLSQQAPVVSFYGSIDTWSDFWFYIGRQGYSGVDVSPSAGWSDRAAFLGWFAADLVRQTTLPGAALALVGLGALARRGGLAAVAAAGSGVLAGLGNSVVLILLLGFDFDVLRVAVFRPYPLICYGVAALWLAVGTQWLLDRLPGRAAARLPAGAAGLLRAPPADDPRREERPRLPAGAAGLLRAPRLAGAATALPAGAAGLLRAPRLGGAATALAALAGAAMVAASASAGWPANDRSGSDFAERHAEMVFDLLPPDAVLFGYGDAAIGPLGYYRYVEGRRPDVALYSLQGLVFANRLYDPRLPEEERARAIDRFVGATGRPVFLSPDADVRPSGRGVGHHGFLLEVLGEGTAGTVDLLRHPPGERYFLELLDRRPADGWEQTRRNGLLSHYGRYLGLVVLSGSPLLLEPLALLFERAQDCYTCLLGMAIALLDNDAAPHANRIAAWLTRAEALHGQALSKSESAQLPFEQGRLAELTGDTATATARYRQSQALDPHPENPAAGALRRLGLTP